MAASLGSTIPDDRLTGTRLGTALGDAPGRPAEGMSARSIARRFGRLHRFRWLGRTGFVSDDTEQAALVAQSLARHPADVDRCVRAFRVSCRWAPRRRESSRAVARPGPGR